MRIGLMVEGQNGLTWERWSHVLALAERLGFPSVFRSDHYFTGPQQQSLEAYLSFVLAASQTTNIRFGPLVSPVTFRSPVEIGRMAAQISRLSGGRFVMGLGAGWNEPEHKAYGIPFPPTPERFDRLDEAIQLISALWREGPASFSGRFYQIDGAECLPGPHGSSMPILIGGGGERRTLRLVARYADEWNAVNMTPEVFEHKLEVLEGHCETEGRDPSAIAKSMMTFGLVGLDESALDSATLRIMSMFGAPSNTTPSEFRDGARKRGFIAGTTGEVVDTLGRLSERGMSEVQFQHFDFDSDEVPEYLASEVAPQVAGLG